MRRLASPATIVAALVIAACSTGAALPEPTEEVSGFKLVPEDVDDITVHWSVNRNGYRKTETDEYVEMRYFLIASNGKVIRMNEAAFGCGKDFFVPYAFTTDPFGPESNRMFNSDRLRIPATPISKQISDVICRQKRSN